MIQFGTLIYKGSHLFGVVTSREPNPEVARLRIYGVLAEDTIAPQDVFIPAAQLVEGADGRIYLDNELEIAMSERAKSLGEMLMDTKDAIRALEKLYGALESRVQNLEWLAGGDK